MKMKQTFMLASVLATMTVSSGAQAYYSGPDFGVQTLSHCGKVPAQNRVYTNSALNLSIIQSKLAGLGYAAPAGTGSYDKGTREAVRRFQADYGLQVDGIVGIETASALAWASNPIPNVRRCKASYTMITR